MLNKLKSAVNYVQKRCGTSEGFEAAVFFVALVASLVVMFVFNLGGMQ